MDANVVKNVIKKEDSTISYHRAPAATEIRFGEGAIHYIDLPKSFCKKRDGEYKKWLIYNGQRYYY